MAATEQDRTLVWDEKRVRTPSVLQMEAAECGAASLAMILAYHGLRVPLEELRVACGVSRDGSKASNVVKAARTYGMEARGFRKEPATLRDLPLPMIVFWNFDHFVVLEGVRKGRAYINDPASGPRSLPIEEFDQSFTGLALTFVPTPEFQHGGEKRSMLAALGRRLKGFEAALTYVVLAGLLLVIPGLLIPVFSRVFVDNILIGRMEGWLKPLLLAMGVTALFRGLLTWFQQSYLLRLETKLALTSSARFFRHVFRLPVEFFAQRLGGEIGSRVQLNDKVAQLLSGELATNLLNLLMIVFYALVMLRYDVALTAVGIGMASLNFVGLRYVSGKRKILNQRLQQESGKIMGISMGGLQMIETLKATGSEPDFYQQWAGYQAKVVNAQQELAIPTQLLSVVPTVLMALTNTAILAVGGLRVMEGHLTMGMLVAFQSLMSSFMAPINQMVMLGSRVQETEADMSRLDDVFQYRLDPRFEEREDRGKSNLTLSTVKLSGDVELKQVSFGYSRLEPPLIRNFSLRVRPGARVAIVGASGSGKSTVAKLVAGLYEPWEGDILFDGKPRSELPSELISNSVSMVDQDIFMFEGSVRDNLSMWDETLPERDVGEAARDACIHEDVAARPGGYLSTVEEGGRNFSGGQLQRLEICRALANHPTVLILDEAMSALDPTTEQLVDAHLRRRGCTCMIIAHRLSTIRDCDEIVVLDRGEVAQRGTHDELMAAGGAYGELIAAHSGRGDDAVADG